MSAARKTSTPARPAEPATEPPAEQTGGDGLVPDAPVVSGDVASKELGEGGRTDDGRPACRVPGCGRPEVDDDAGLCGAHWSLRPDLRRAARRD